ncbi:putative bifunctional diguanylate cyclase/phosphodiesterase [Paractinoplanes atraurantiacus]|uniref:Diguanylate cyclase (GGDEF) domain-containing protein n=1 Tax=Paractinoplanes atraurantiacus TaxID=1036182 RepID=A0A285K1S2_9ACTN|nr:bifunctional diguanylate cyclase/phosphodiesterase [Actinoplanes atraurantiacus]SNY66539.1 diguanylate cyclase (GGDEF) domain-containing protein [Actinoplanes atraurantiacus]
MRQHAWWWLLVAAALMLGAAQLYGFSVRSVTSGVVALGACAGVIWGVRLYKPDRAVAWRLLAGAAACAGLGMLSSVGFPRWNLVDVLHPATFLLALGGLVLLPRRDPSTGRPGGLAETGVIVCTGALVAWVLLYDPYVYDADVPPSPEVLIYPLADVLVLGLALRLFALQERLPRPHLLVVAAATLFAASDIRFFLAAVAGTVSGPELSVTGWGVAFALIAAAALHPAMASHRAIPEPKAGSWKLMAVHLALVLTGPAVTAYALIRDIREEELDVLDIGVPVTFTAVITVMLVVRMTLTLRLARRQASAMRHMVLHDALTDLPNRHLLTAEVASSGALILFDLDGFKDVNDRLGHSLGDELLVAIAGRLRPMLRPGEMLARTGGDEFALLLPSSDAIEVTARAGDVLAAVRSPFAVSGHTLHVTGSAGIRLLAPGADVAEVLSDADLALYAAKAAGKDRAELFDPRLRQEQIDRVRMVEHLRAGLEHDEFTVHYQPIVALCSGLIVAVEALVRWTPPGRPPIGPDRFIPAAEDSGLIIDLGERVLRRACADAAVWHGRYGIAVTVNVSPRQLADPAFTAKANRAIADSGLHPSALTLEITEGVLIGSGAQALAHLHALRAEGVRVAIDDFGTGYSSLAYLRDLPIDTLKIDKSFMPADPTDRRQTALVRAVVDLARSLNLTTVAEGVETAHHADLLRELGCDRGQGYLFARPTPSDQVTALLTTAWNAPRPSPANT